MITEGLGLAEKVVVGRETIEVLSIVLVVAWIALPFFVVWAFFSLLRIPIEKLKEHVENFNKVLAQKIESNNALADAVLSLIKAVEKLDASVIQSQQRGRERCDKIEKQMEDMPLKISEELEKKLKGAA